MKKFEIKPEDKITIKFLNETDFDYVFHFANRKFMSKKEFIHEVSNEPDRVQSRFEILDL